MSLVKGMKIVPKGYRKPFTVTDNVDEIINAFYRLPTGRHATKFLEELEGSNYAIRCGRTPKNRGKNWTNTHYNQAVKIRDGCYVYRVVWTCIKPKKPLMDNILEAANGE